MFAFLWRFVFSRLLTAFLTDYLQAVKAFVTEAEAALASQEKDNSDIYHELIPTTLPELQGIALAKVCWMAYIREEEL